MHFFKAILEAGKIAVALGLVAIILSTAGIQLFSSAVLSIPGLALLFTFLVFLVLWVKW